MHFSSEDCGCASHKCLGDPCMENLKASMHGCEVTIGSMCMLQTASDATAIVFSYLVSEETCLP